MLEKFDNNLPPADDALPGRHRKLKTVVRMLAVLVVLAGAAAILLDESVIRAARKTASPAYAALRRHFADGISMEAASRFFEEIRTGKAPSRQDGPGREATAILLYTVELKDGGRIEGRSISVGKESVTVTDEMGVSMEVARDRIARITTLRQ